MREILFRGQTRRYGEKVRLNGEKIKSNWVYGGIFPQNGEGDFAIIYQQKPTIGKYPVYADTVGQYTGFTDKNGAKIFEGDILAFDDMDDSKGIYEVFWDGNNGKFAIAASGNRNYVDDFELFDELFERNEYFKWFTVIGNIYDSPELLKQIVATVTNIDGMDYRSIESDMTDDDKTLKPVGEGTVIPQTKIKSMSVENMAEMLLDESEAEE